MEYEEEGFVTGLQAATHVGTIWGRGRTSRVVEKDIGRCGNEFPEI